MPKSIVVKRLYAGPMSTLGSCCVCGTKDKVYTIATLAIRGTEPGTGWGCNTCGLPHDGAIATLCENCKTKEPEKFCVGVAMLDERRAISDVSENVFNHHSKCTMKDAPGFAV